MKTIKLFIILLLVSNQSSAQCWTTVNTSGRSTIGLQTDGSLWAWGLNLYGILGLGIESSQTTFPTTQIGSDTDWSSNYSVGIDHVLAIKNNGILYAWGNNERGESGNGTSGSQNFILAPQQIGTDTWKAVAASSSYSLGIKTNGSLWAWGINDVGQLGTGNLIWQNTPTQVGADTNWDKVFSVNRVSYAIKTDGTLWSWGDGDSNNYALGYVPTANNYLTPHQIGTQNNWVAIAPYFGHVAGLRSDGTLWAWGRNIDSFNNPYYGNGIPDTNNYQNNPTQIGTDTDWTHITISDQNFFALKTNGTLWGWGINNQGRLGDGTTITRYIPTQLGMESDWILVDVGQDVGDQHYALKTNHALYKWGTPNSIPTLQGNTCNLSTTSFDFKTVQAFPNPTSNRISLYCNFPFDSPTEITIYNLLGQTIKTIHQSPSVSENIVVDLSSLEKGIYLLQIKNKQRLEVLKVLKN
jgi:alpha-tubulin suppressor-like RCC1 family protein